MIICKTGGMLAPNALCGWIKCGSNKCGSDQECDLQRKHHDLKTDPEVFQQSLDGVKPWEIRYNDRSFQVGDTVCLKETKHSGAEMKAGASLEYTGRELTKTITNVVSGYGLQDNWVVLTMGDA
mgnify:CR=1 FL=1